MKDEEKEIFIARVKGLMDDHTLLPEIRKTKRSLIHYAQQENWDKVSSLAEELKILHEEYILRFESKAN